MKSCIYFAKNYLVEYLEHVIIPFVKRYILHARKPVISQGRVDNNIYACRGIQETVLKTTVSLFKYFAVSIQFQ